MGDGDHFYPGSFYLDRVDAQKRRFYAKFEPFLEEQKESATDSIEVEQDDIGSLTVDDEMGSKMQIPNLGHFIGDAVLIGAQKVLDKAQNHGLSTKGAIQIDKVLTKTHQVTTRCSNS